MMHFKLLLGMCLLHFFLKANSHHLFGAKSDDSDDGHDTSLMDAHQDQLGMIILTFASDDCSISI